MKLIKPGASNEWWVGRKFTCAYCRAVMELEAGDAVKTYTSDEIGLSAFFNCGQCNAENRIYFEERGV